jgi:hypothetical protein
MHVLQRTMAHFAADWPAASSPRGSRWEVKMVDISFGVNGVRESISCATFAFQVARVSTWVSPR